ncbi:bifunctional helix-turn-helix transcriptional regulator/GNAT family N-acetyltransferase [Larkinella terrae]|uniref:GNAT family N-acetyltransferase n=1 Tax=Larkinella terrae TaxID=2025311 RepID=A0A7K0EU33_9BACT|nr:bifunctional helix-turn-helix transcriptional regulator/GNAT family N-acetyltransferase [Larkinella terrae]MRS64938.1 GNAT family N-acetyltransferase [Larkinella terrae]
MDLMAQLGPLAFGSRLRRLSDLISKQASAVYESFGIDFDPKWFTLFYLLSRKPPLSVTEIADELGFSHPAIIQLAKELELAGLIRSEKSGKDSRKRLLSLSDKGRELLPELEKIWQAINELNTKLINKQRHNLIFAMEEMEETLAEEHYLSRFKTYFKMKQLDEVEIIDFDPAYREQFKQLNLAWIEKYFKVEEPDIRALSNPEGYIIDKGGRVFFARYNHEIVGTCALLKQSEGVYELVKMAVSPEAQGKQIGKKLCIHAVEMARQMGARQVYLESNTRLTPALELYKKVGFYKVESSPSPYQRSNIKMQMDL